MFKNQTNIIEEQKFKQKNIIRLSYLGIFLIWITAYLVIQKVEQSYSDSYIFFALGFIFALISLIGAWKMPNNRDKTLKFFKLGMLAYSLYTILIDILIFAGNLGGDSGNSVNIIKTIGFYTRLVIPLGMIIWQAKSFSFLTGIRKSKEKTIDYIKKHGNDGMK